MAPMTFERITVFGAGAWGAALANTAARAGRSVTLIARDAKAASAIATSRESPRLPGVALDKRIDVIGDAADADANAPVLLVVPAQELRAASARLTLAPGTPVIACAKGIEQGTHLFMTEVIAQVLPHSVPAILSGPSFATDVARGLPTAVTLACADDELAGSLAAALGSATFRPYHATDVRGVEIGGAAKNVLAIAAGIVNGRGLGASASAALTTRGFAELFRFGQAFGAKPETLTGLSGLGDLVLSCSSAQSRNYSLGLALGQGDAAAAGGKLAEGAFTAKVLVEMAWSRDVEMPISEAIAAILSGELNVDQAIEALLTRPFKAEG
jgi:glycerol-3-phosphate dehydrogenase (NAD(P)+)